MRLRVAALLMAAAAACALVGCTGQGGVTRSNGGCAGPGVTPRQISFGVVFPASGASAQTYAPYRAGVEARLGVANATGGIGDRKVTYRWADDGGLPSSNLAAARQLSRAGVFGIAELSTAASGSAAWLHARNIPVVGAAVDPIWRKYRNMFTYLYYVSAGSTITTWGDYVAVHGGRRAALLESSDVGSRSTADQYANSLRAAGIRVDAIEADTRVTAPADIVAQMVRNHDDTVTGATDALLFARTAALAKRTVPGLKVILSPVGYDKTLLDAFGETLSGMTTPIFYTPFEQHTAPIEKFLSAMARYSPQVQPSANEVALGGWLDTDLMLTGLAAAGPCPTRGSFMAGLRNTTDYEAGGLLVAPVNFKTNFGRLNNCYIFVRIAPSGTSWNVVRPAPFCGRSIG